MDSLTRISSRGNGSHTQCVSTANTLDSVYTTDTVYHKRYAHATVCKGVQGRASASGSHVSVPHVSESQVMTASVVKGIGVS